MRNYLISELTYKNNRGFTLVSTLMVLVVLSILGISILMITSNLMEISAGERNDQSVFYVAEAGVVERVYDINEDVEVAFQTVKTIYDKLPIKEKGTFDFIGKFYSEVVSKVDLSPLTMSSFETSFGNQPSASITVTKKSANPPEYKIKSVGMIGNKTRTVTQEIKVILDPTLIEGPGLSGKMALYVKKTINLAGSVKIYGDAGTESTDPRDVKFTPEARVTGEIYQGVNSSINLPSFPTFPTYNIPPDQLYELNQYEKTDLVKNGYLLINNHLTQGYTLNMSNNLQFKEIFLDGNQTLIINVGNSNKEIVVDHLNVTNGHIKIVGSGKLTIYIKDKLTMGSGSTINTKYNGLWDHSKPGMVDKLQIYQKGFNSITLAGDQKIYGSLYAEAANITITGGGGFKGDIYTGGTEVTVNGGTSVNTQLFLAPNAKFTLAQGGHIKGSIIADSFIGTGGGSITYDVTNLDSGSGGPIKDYGNGKNLTIKRPLLEK